MKKENINKKGINKESVNKVEDDKSADKDIISSLHYVFCNSFYAIYL